jgi:hypothetical protein
MRRQYSDENFDAFDERGVMKDRKRVRVSMQMRDASTTGSQQRGSQPGDACTIDGWRGVMRNVNGELQCVPLRKSDAKPVITDGYGHVGEALQRPGFRLSTDASVISRQKLVADSRLRAERQACNRFKVNDGEELCPSCGGEGYDEDGNECKTCHGEGVMPDVEDKRERSTGKGFGSGNEGGYNGDSSDAVTRQRQRDQAYLIYDRELAAAWRNNG